jgi:SPP1 family predicted phage head-tail adaptor
MSLSSDLNRRITIEQPVNSGDGAGGATVSWSDVATLFANIEPQRGSFSSNGFREQSEITHRVTIRYLAGLSSKMRVKYGSRYFNIRAIVNEDEKNERLILICQEGAGT